jgi:N-acetyl sugar amidotransferase
VVENAKKRSHGYDCLVPVSGGKDSTWQVVRCLEYGLKPLAVTWRPPGRTEIGQRNLENLIQLGVDHIDYAINPDVEKRFMLETLERNGSSGIPMHLGLFNIPLKIASRFDIPLVIWGENSATEYGNESDQNTGFKLDAKWLKKYGVSHGTTARDWVSKRLTEKDLTPYFGPSDEELEKKGILAVFMGYYFPWDPRETHRIAKLHGFQSSSEGPKTGLYEFADIDDDFISIHHFLKWHKFGFTRLYDNLSLEIRNGRITRETAVQAIRDRGDETPRQDIQKFCAFVGISEDRFFEICEKFRNTSVWVKKDHHWEIPGFLIPDWKWV